MPTIAQELGAVDKIFWPMVTFLSISIVGAAITPLTTNRLGRNRAYALMFVLYAIGVIGSAIATNFDSFTIFRGLQGFAGGMLVTLSYALIPTLFEKQEVGKLFAFTSLVWGSAALLGPLMGSLWVNADMWRLGLCSLLPILGGVLVLVTTSKHLRLSVPEISAQFSWGILAALITAIFVIAFSAGQLSILAKLIVLGLGISIFAAAVVRDSLTESSLFPSLKPNQSSAPKLITLVIFVLSCAISSISIYIPLMIQEVFRSSVLIAGYFHSIEAVAWSLAALAATYFTWIRPFSYIRIGVFTMSLGMFLLAYSISANNFNLAALAIFCCGIGIGLSWSHATGIVVNSVEPTLAEQAASSLSTIQLLAYGFSAAISGTIVNLASSATMQTAEDLAVGGRSLFLAFGVASNIAFILMLLIRTPAKNSPI